MPVAQLKKPVRKAVTSLRIVRMEQACEVCGQSSDPRFLKTWNDKQVCTKCIAENTRDYNF